MLPGFDENIKALYENSSPELMIKSKKDKFGFRFMKPKSIYALDTIHDLKRGFLLNELYRKMDGHILDSFTLKGFI